MLQFDAKSSVTLVTGRSGSGKTTFALRFLVSDTKLQCRFVFDPEGEYSAKLGVPGAETLEELGFAVEDGFCVFDPHALFPGNVPKAFAFFCDYVFNAASRLPGRKLVLVDEVWKYCSPNSIPFPLSNCIQTGRKRGLEMMFCTQRPNKLNEAITNEVTELVFFSLKGANAIKCLHEAFDIDPDEVRALDKGQYVSISIDTDGELRGSVFKDVPPPKNPQKSNVALCQNFPSPATVRKPVKRNPTLKA